MSDLGKLFRLRGSAHMEPLENFTTTALAIAIGHDDRPMKLALQGVDWTCEPVEGRPAIAVPELPYSIEKITADTQVVLWPGSGTLGYLDLVLHVLGPRQRESTIWVEVKVDALEHGTQLENYRTHAAARPVRPAIITLARTRLSPKFPSLKWLDVDAAIENVDSPHHAWLSLREFLLHEKIVRPPLPSQGLDVNACAEIIVDVNKRVRAVWPDGGLAWHSDKALRSALLKSPIEGRDLSASAGPVRYGLMPVDTGWEWVVVFTTAKNYQGVRLDPQQALEDADRGGLSPEWRRYTDRRDVLERRVQMGTMTSHDDIVGWFEESLRQLQAAKVLDRFFAARANKTAGRLPAAAPQSRAPTTILLGAVQFAAVKHRTQLRKGADGSPYVNHPIGVADLLARVGGISDVDTLVAAVLHDTVEDTDATPDELERRFGRAVRDMVVEVTDDKTLEKAVRKELQVEHAATLSAPAKAIRIADKIMNVQDVADTPPPEWDVNRRLEYLDWAERVVAACRGTNSPLEEYFDDVLKRANATLGAPER
jgi:hypothetical protein